MTEMYNYFAHSNARHLHGRRANFLTQGAMTASSELKLLRKQTGLPVRAIAERLGFEQHSKYTYYESAKFKGPLPLELARKIAQIFSTAGVPASKVLSLAGLDDFESTEEANQMEAESKLASREIYLPVIFPSTNRLTAMFDGLLAVVGIEDPSGEHAQMLAGLLPSALEGASLDALADQASRRKAFYARYPRSLAKANPDSSQS